LRPCPRLCAEFQSAHDAFAALINRRGRPPRNRGVDLKAAKHKRLSDDVRRLVWCEMELARGSSHIASMLYEQSIHAAVRETLLHFEACHGRADLQTFAFALLGRLKQRGNLAAVGPLHDFIEHGRLPELTAGTPALPVSGRRRVVPHAASNPVNGRTANG
jgi:hypothetical protein